MFSPTRLLTPAAVNLWSLCKGTKQDGLSGNSRDTITTTNPFSAQTGKLTPPKLGHSVFNQPKRTPTSAGRTAVGGVAAAPLW
ncbi:hypothetical protein BJF96_g2245 [Verticillium dahliae]|uniref:Uncharacterized protein n=1 Tax=Verticillium dahliae TaxID=27337 RepID=A0AA44WPB7_VERDA|nr:hypothetical protein BJF96_g2245 [Verticillium dahliae]PNH41848.1 hypothetical protein VD0003_g9907 [Verticillium dahliae]